MKYWEIIADRLSKSGWSWGVSSGFMHGKPIFVADARSVCDKRIIVRADEKLSAFLELERQIRDYEGAR